MKNIKLLDVDGKPFTTINIQEEINPKVIICDGRCFLQESEDIYKEVAGYFYHIL